MNMGLAIAGVIGLARHLRREGLEGLRAEGLKGLLLLVGLSGLVGLGLLGSERLLLLVGLLWLEWLLGLELLLLLLLLLCPGLRLLWHWLLWRVDLLRRRRWSPGVGRTGIGILAPAQRIQRRCPSDFPLLREQAREQAVYPVVWIAALGRWWKICAQPLELRPHGLVGDDEGETAGADVGGPADAHRARAPRPRPPGPPRSPCQAPRPTRQPTRPAGQSPRPPEGAPGQRPVDGPHAAHDAGPGTAQAPVQAAPQATKATWQ